MNSFVIVLMQVRCSIDRELATRSSRLKEPFIVLTGRRRCFEENGFASASSLKDGVGFR